MIIYLLHIYHAKRESKFFTTEVVGPRQRLAMMTILLLLSNILEDHKFDKFDINFFPGLGYVQWTSGRVESNLMSLIRALKVTSPASHDLDIG